MDLRPKPQMRCRIFNVLHFAKKKSEEDLSKYIEHTIFGRLFEDIFLIVQYLNSFKVRYSHPIGHNSGLWDFISLQYAAAGMYMRCGCARVCLAIAALQALLSPPLPCPPQRPPLPHPQRATGRPLCSASQPGLRLGLGDIP